MNKKIRFILVRRLFFMGSSTTTNYAKKKQNKTKRLFTADILTSGGPWSGEFFIRT